MKKDIKKLISERTRYLFYKDLMLEQISGDDFVQAIQLVVQSQRPGDGQTDARNEIQNPRSAAGALASEFKDKNLASKIAGTVSNKEMDEQAVKSVLQLLFQQIRNMPDSGKIGLLDQYFNLDDNILAALDEELAQDIIDELEDILRSSPGAIPTGNPAQPVDIQTTLPILRDIFQQILASKTGLLPAGFGE